MPNNIKKILIAISIAVITIASLIYINNLSKPSYFGGDEIPEELKIKKNLKDNDKKNIVKVKDIDWLELTPKGTINKGKIKSYDYITDKKTNVNAIFRNGNKFTNEVRIEDGAERKTHYYNGDQFYLDDSGDIYEIATDATTTIEAYEAQTADSLVSKIKNFLVGNAKAACGDPGDSCYYSGSGDGRVYLVTSPGYSQTEWDTCHDATTGTKIDNAATGVWGSWFEKTNNRIVIFRDFLSFDTSAEAGRTVVSASVYITTQAKTDDINDAYAYVAILQGLQASPTGLANDDYNDCGDAVDNPTKGSANFDLTSNFVVNNPTEIPLNATGLTWINTSGYTQLCMREGHDIEDAYWAPSGNDNSDLSHYYSEQSGTGYDPYIEIISTSGGGATPSAERRQSEFWW